MRLKNSLFFCFDLFVFRKTVESRSCQWKRPSVGAQKNEFGERHEVLTIVGCVVNSEKPRARNLFRFLESRPISSELTINYPPHDDGKTFNMNENYSVVLRGRQHKQTNSTVKYSTGLIQLDEGIWF